MAKTKLLIIGYSSFAKRRLIPSLDKNKNFNYCFCSKSNKININNKILYNIPFIHYTPTSTLHFYLYPTLLPLPRPSVGVPSPGSAWLVARPRETSPRPWRMTPRTRCGKASGSAQGSSGGTSSASTRAGLRTEISWRPCRWILK